MAGLEAPLAEYSMPLPEARELARYLVETAVGYARFSPGLREVAGPTQIAVLRRPYYDASPTGATVVPGPHVRNGRHLEPARSSGSASGPLTGL